MRPLHRNELIWAIVLLWAWSFYPAPSKAFDSNMGSCKNARSPIPDALRGHSRFRSLRLPLTLTLTGFMIVSITARFRWTKIQSHACFCFRIRRPRSSSFDNCILESSSTCVFQGGIKMHDRSTLVCRLRAPIGTLLSFHKVARAVGCSPSYSVRVESHWRSSRSLLPKSAPTPF